MARIGYIRVSTKEQDTARQEDLLKNQNIDKFFIEKISGKNTDRPELKKMLDYVREGDTVVVVSYSRFSRSTSDLLKLVEELNTKGVDFVSLHENVDTTTPCGKLMMTMFAGLAQYERDIIKQQQAEGIEAKKKADAELKARGEKAVTYKGRQPINIDGEAFAEQYNAWKRGEKTAREAMRTLGLKSNTWYRRVKEYEGAEA